MNTDAYFEVGTNHSICEDYAIHGSAGNLHYIIGADGCSMSKHSDVGARLLCYAARSALLFLDSVGELCNDVKQRLEICILNNCRNLMKELHLPPEVFDATLLMAFSNGNFCNMFIWGDGGFIVKTDSYEKLFLCEYPSGAPCYLSYRLDAPQRFQRYINEYGGSFVGTAYDLSTLENEEERGYLCRSNGFDHDFLTGWKCELLKTVSIVSDGINSYQAKDGGDVKDTFKVVIPSFYVNYKSRQGEFVKRRMLRLKRNFEKKGVTHYDDIFCATINFEDLDEKP